MVQTNEQFVIFTIQKSLYGISIRDVLEIVRLQEVEWTSDSKDNLLGVIQVRGNEIPIISLHQILNETEKEVDSRTRMIIMQHGEREVGFVVDEVDQVKILQERYISAPPHLSQNRWVRGVYHQDNLIITLPHMGALLANAKINKR